MGQVTVTLNGRTYRLRCGDGEEQRLFALAEHIRAKVDRLVSEFGQIGDDRLLLMSALLVTDELFECRERLASLDQSSCQSRPAQPGRRTEPATDRNSGLV